MATLLQTWYTYYARRGTSTPTGTGDIRGRVDVYLESQNTSANTSYIRIDHRYQYTKGSGYSFSSNPSGNTSSYRANQGSYGGNYQSISFNNRTETASVTRTLGSKYHTVTHKASGEGTLYVNGSLTFNGQFISINGTFPFLTTRASSFTKVLPTINRGTTISTFTLTPESLDELKVTWATADNISKIEYQIGSGSWTNGETSINKKSGNFIIGGLNPGTTYSIKVRVTRYSNSVTTTSSAKSGTTIDIARFTTTPNNVDFEQPFTVQFNRNGADLVEVGIYDTAGASGFALYREAVGTSYEFNLTQGEKDLLYADMINTSSKTYRFFIATNSNTFRTYQERTFIVTGAQPLFQQFTYKDINATTLALTGDDQSVIKDYSNIEFTISEANKAIGVKGATVLNYQAMISPRPPVSVPYQSSGDVTVTVNQAGGNTLQVYATDSRNLTTVVSKLATTYFAYVKPTVSNFAIARANQLSETTILNISGEYFNADFGSQVNQINLEVYYRLVGDNTWLLSDSIASGKITYNANQWSFNDEVAGDLGASGFDAGNSYEIMVVVNDKLANLSRETVLPQGIPGMAIHKDGVAVGALYDDILGGALQVTGDIYQNGLPLSGGGIELVELWSGSWSSGTITLSDDITNYAYCYVVWESQGTIGIVPVLPQDLKTDPATDIGHFRGGGQTVTSTGQYLYSISATFDYTVKPTKLTWVDSYRLTHTPSSNHSSKTQQTVIRIVGVKLDGDADSGTDFTGIKADLFYESGDGITISEESQRYTVSGFISSNTKYIIFSIRTDKSMKYVTSVELASLKANIRSDKGYVGTGAYVSGGYDFFNDNDFTFIVEKIDNWNISVQMMSANTLNATNNTPCVLGFGEISFTTDQ